MLAQTIDKHLEDCEACEDTVQNLERETSLGLKLPALSSEVPADNSAHAELIAGLRQIRPAASPVHATSADVADSLVGSTLREYELLELVDKGGMGAVYRAEHTSLGRTVAVKVLPESSLQNEALVKRFRREMKAVGRLDHPNIVRATDAGEIDGTHFLAMEYVDGPNLSRLLGRNGPLRIEDACEVIRQAAAALQVAHEAGLVHRDIKPSNLMLTGSGQVKVLDLGLALLHDEHLEQGHTDLTSHSQIMGTADYMAPEQAIDTHNVDIRADIYSLGCTLFFLLTGRAPYRSEQPRNAMQTMMAHVQEPIPSVLEARCDTPKKLAAIVDRMLAKEPDGRPTPPAEIVKVLESFAKGANLAALIEAFAQPVTEPSQQTTETYSQLTDTVEHKAQPPPRPNRTPKKKIELPHRASLAIGFILSLLVLAGIVFRIQTNDGELVINVDKSIAEQVVVNVKRGEEHLVDGWQLKSGENVRTLSTGPVSIELPSELAEVVKIGNSGDLIVKRKQQLVLTVSLVSNVVPEATKQVVFSSGTEGYNTYRIPSLITTNEGTLLAFCEGRSTRPLVQGNADLVLKRSTDQGATWGDIELIHGADQPGKFTTIGNPCPVIDQQTRSIWLIYCRNNEQVLVRKSNDDGQTWSKPVDISRQVVRSEWVWVATGPGVGIQLSHGQHKGRLVIPCDRGVLVDGKRVTYSHVIYSDDSGVSWKVGGSLGPHTNECQVAELADGRLILNMRNHWGSDGGRPDRGSMRAVSTSIDGGNTWSELAFDETLIEPACQASFLRLHRPKTGTPGPLLFSNPASQHDRRDLTVRASYDQGTTWAKSMRLHTGPAAYSCLTVLPNGQLGCLYEAGQETPHETLTSPASR